MAMVKRIFGSNYFLWLIFALPAFGMISGLMSGDSSFERLLHPTGEFAARFMIIAMMISPLRIIFPKAGWLMWMMRRRRHFGVAAFFYALLHTVFYVVDMGTLQTILDEIFALGIWTGWVAFIIFIPLAITSNDAAQKALLSAWKPLQRWVYPAAILTLAHWVFVHNNLGPALVHFLPLAALEIWRIWKIVSKPTASPAI